jgi:hypothetical protein
MKTGALSLVTTGREEEPSLGGDRSHNASSYLIREQVASATMLWCTAAGLGLSASAKIHGSAKSRCLSGTLLSLATRECARAERKKTDELNVATINESGACCGHGNIPMPQNVETNTRLLG